MVLDKKFWFSKKVLITGNTGFKGTWLTKLLISLGSKLIGYSNVDANSILNYEDLKNNKNFTQLYGDINNLNNLKIIVSKHKPQIIFHLAAQSLVFKSYISPIETFNTNAIGTLNILEISRCYDFINSTIIVTSDKCYTPTIKKKYFDEKSQLGGIDPYSASKAMSEIVALSYVKSFPKLNVATARAGNVIGGGDWSEKRLLPDLMKLIYNNKKLNIRNLTSVRPWQHVLEPLTGYILLAKKLFNEKNKNSSIYRSGWNFGPPVKNHKNVMTLIKIIEKNLGKNIKFKHDTNKFHEEKSIFLNSNKSKKLLKWQNTLSLENSIKFTQDWYENFYKKENQIKDYTNLQINKYLKYLNDSKKNKN